jgi:rubrerythrin
MSTTTTTAEANVPTPDDDAFMRALLTTPAGRAFMLSIAVDAEEGDEAGYFEQVADAVDEPDLRRIVLIHRDDEVRHAGLYRSCLERNGYAKLDLPPTLGLIYQLGNRASDAGPEGRSFTSAEDIMFFYALLHAVEQRGIDKFPRIADAFERHDPETAETYRRVTRDERGHVRYCQRIGRHYAGSDEAWVSALAITAEIEAMAFERTNQAQIAYCVDHGLIDHEDLLAISI